MLGQMRRQNVMTYAETYPSQVRDVLGQMRRQNVVALSMMVLARSVRASPDRSHSGHHQIVRLSVHQPHHLTSQVVAGDTGLLGVHTFDTLDTDLGNNLVHECSYDMGD